MLIIINGSNTFGFFESDNSILTITPKSAVLYTKWIFMNERNYVKRCIFEFFIRILMYDRVIHVYKNERYVNRNLLE